VEDAENAADPEPGNEYADLPERRVTFNQLAAWNLTYFRKAAGLTGEELGALLGWSKAVVSAAERSWDRRRVRQFSVDDLATIALALGVPVIAFFLPPPDAGIAVRYVLSAERKQPDIIDLLPRLAPAYGGTTPALAAFRDRILALGASRYMDPAGEEVERLLTRARTEADSLLIKSRRQSEQLTGEARARAEALERDAQERHRRALSSLVQSREELERRVDDLRAFEKEYRRRLLAYLEGQVADLKAGDYDDGVFPDPPAARPEGRLP